MALHFLLFIPYIKISCISQAWYQYVLLNDITIYVFYNKQTIVLNKIYNFITFEFIKYNYSVDLKTVLIYSISLFVKLLWINLSYYIHSNSLVNKYYSREISNSALDLWKWSVDCRIMWNRPLVPLNHYTLQHCSVY